MSTRNSLLLCVLIGACLTLTVTGDWPGSKIVDGRCFVLKQEMVTWDNAQTACAGMGGKLATIASLQVLNDAVAAFNMSKDKFVWIGANSKAVRGTYVWDETNQPATEITKDWWWLGDPMGYRCVYIRPEHPYITTSDCTLRNYYLCIEPNSTTKMCAAPTPPPPPATPPPTTTPPTTTTRKAPNSVADKVKHSPTPKGLMDKVTDKVKHTPTPKGLMDKVADKVKHNPTPKGLMDKVTDKVKHSPTPKGLMDKGLIKVKI